MPVTYTNRKGVSYTLYKGETKTGKPRYYFGRSGEGQGKPVEKLPPGFTISESVNGIVSLVKDRPLLIQPEEVAAVEAVLKRHPKARRYRISVKSKWIEVYENSSPDIEPLLRRLGWLNSWVRAGLRRCRPSRSTMPNTRQFYALPSSIQSSGSSEWSGCAIGGVLMAGWN